MPVNDKALPGTDVELALAAIPVAGEDDRVCLGDVKAPGGIQASLDVEPVPVQLALRERDAREGQRQKDAHCRDLSRRSAGEMTSAEADPPE